MFVFFWGGGLPFIMKPHHCDFCDLIDVLIVIITVTSLLRGEISVTCHFAIKAILNERLITH